MKDETSTSIEGRRSERVPLDAVVSVSFPTIDIVGPGKNISAEGLYFTADAALPVTVHVDGRAIHGHLVRFESMGNGKVGIAIRFVAT